MAGNMTIKALADSLGVSKTAIRNYMTDDFRAKYTAKDSKGVITITPEGCKLVSANFGKEPGTSAKQNPETELITIPLSVWKLMEDQLREKDEQLRVKDQQLADLTAAVRSQADSINTDRHNELAGTLRPMLDPSSTAVDLPATVVETVPESSESSKQPFWKSWFPWGGK